MVLAAVLSSGTPSKSGAFLLAWPDKVVDEVLAFAILWAVRVRWIGFRDRGRERLAASSRSICMADMDLNIDDEQEIEADVGLACKIGKEEGSLRVDVELQSLDWL